jgi:hypothetical protein
VNDPVLFTPEELSLVADDKFFLAKARIMKKVRTMLDRLHAELREELSGLELLAPEGFNPAACQFVKGEHLEDYPYQYLDFPKHFAGSEKFTFRSLFWWGHAFVFALILEGEHLLRYKQNLINRFSDVADRQLCLSLGPSLWEWKRGTGYTVEITRERKSEVAAVLSGRQFFKLARFLRPDDPLVREGRLVETGRRTFRTILPIITS